MFKRKIEEDLKKIVRELGYSINDIVCDIPKNPAFGDYTSNVALQLANQSSDVSYQSSDKTDNQKKAPRVIAQEIESRIMSQESSKEYLEKVEVAGSGFLNFFIKPEALMANLHQVCDYSSLVKPEVQLEEDKKKILVEYAHPNTHKAFHIGHVRNITLGESISRLLEAAGNEVFRANYQGDIGLHVAKALWGVKKLQSEGTELVNLSSLKQKAEFLGKAYSLGATAYEENETAKTEISDINKKLYLKDPEVVQLWEQTRKWSLDYFDDIYQKFGVKFDRLFFESEVEVRGKELVKENIGKVFEEDDGAVIFRAEKHGLHTRVLLNKAGNPTYEAKELGLGEAEKEAFNFDKAVHVVGTDQAGYLQVMFKALEELDSWYKNREIHLSYGLVKLSTGKMASRTGNVVTFDWLFDEVKKRVGKIATSSATPRNDNIDSEELDDIVNKVSLGAIKFSMLKYSPSSDATFNIEKSVSLQGDSGPYVQYSYARAKSVLRNAKYDYQPTPIKSGPTEITGELEKEERDLLRQMEHFEFIVSKASDTYSPNTLAEYLLDLAKAFNLFYQKHQIISGSQAELRLALTCGVDVILKQGLYILGIESPERM